MKTLCTRVLSVVLAVCMLGFGAFAQSGQGSVEGTVTDASGAVVPGVTISLTNTATNLGFTATSNGEGYFRFPVVPVGNYDFTAEGKSFSPFKSSGLQVTVGAKVNLPITLGVAKTEQSVNVSGEAPLVETTRSSVSNTVNTSAISELPVNGRNFIDFTLLTPGVVRDVRTGDLSFAGQRGTLNSLTIDGSDNNNTFFGQTLGRTGSGRAPYQFSEDAVQEFQVNTNGYSAEIGRAGGAVINVVTKSGGNQFHGTAFEFFRDRGMNADDPIYKFNRAYAISQGRPEPLRPGYHFHQFGGNLGGPIIKNKAFFFFDYDGQRNNIGNVVSLTLPSSVNPALFDADQQRAYDYLQARANSYSTTFNQNVYLGKVDYILNSKNQLSLRYNAQRFLGGNLENSGAVSSGVPSTSSFEHTGNSNVNTDTFNLQLTSTLTNSLINELKFSYQRDNEPGLANSNNPEALVREAGSNLLYVGRNSFSPRETTIHRQQYADNISWVRGTHTLKFGFDVLKDNILNFFPGNFSGAYTFTSLKDFGLSLANQPLPAGSTSSLTEAFSGTGTTGPKTTPNMVQYAGFVQDDWRATRALTVNLGLRYDLQTYQQPSVTNAMALAAGINTGVIHEDKNNIAPRIGFAYSPMANTVVRGGYGIFYGNTPSIMVGTALSNNGINVQTLRFTSASVPTYPNNVCGTPSAQPNCPPPAAGGTASAPSIYVFDPNYRQPMIQQYNVQVERQIGKDASFSLGYIGVRGEHIQRTRDINLGTPTPASIAVSTDPTQVYNYLVYPSARPITAFRNIYQFEATADSYYNGMVATFAKRFSERFGFNAAYTWSHAIDNAPDATAVVPGVDDAKLLYYPSISALDRSSSVNDVRHRFVLSGNWNLDSYAKNFNGVSRYALGGWQISGILTAQSGQPYSAYVTTDLNNDGNSRNERVPGTGRNSYTLPSLVTFDPRVTKSFTIRENMRLQLIGEAFNMFNRFNVTGVRNTLYSVVAGQLVPQTTGQSAFGQPFTSGGPRILQVAAKFTF